MRDLDDRSRRVDDRRKQERARDHPEGGKVAQLPVDDVWPDGVADRDYQDLGDRTEGGRGDIEPDEHAAPDEADTETEDPAPPVALPAPRQQPDHDADERHRRDQKSRERARDAKLSIGQ